MTYIVSSGTLNPTIPYLALRPWVLVLKITVLVLAVTVLVPSLAVQPVDKHKINVHYHKNDKYNANVSR